MVDARHIAPLIFSGVLFVGMLLLLEAGRRVGTKRKPSESEPERSNLGTVEAAVFALFGLLVAFTFSGAALRFNEKRMLIADEANAIGTAYLRLHLVAQHAQPELRELFRQYVDSRLETYRKMPNMEAAAIEISKSEQFQQQIWTKAVAATTLPNSHSDAGKLLLPALNSMIDISTTRMMALQVHPPNIIYGLLFVLGLLCSLLVGYRMATGQHRSWLHILSSWSSRSLSFLSSSMLSTPRGSVPPRGQRSSARPRPRKHGVKAEKNTQSVFIFGVKSPDASYGLADRLRIVKIVYQGLRDSVTSVTDPKLSHNR